MWDMLKGRYRRHCRRNGVRAYLTIPFVGCNLVVLSLLIFDQPVSASVLQSQSVLRVMGAYVTELGKSGWILFACAILLFEALSLSRLAHSATARFHALFIGQVAAYLLATVSISGLLVNLAKRLIGRGRPLYQTDAGSFSLSPLHGGFQFESFPSGHATTVGAILMGFSLLAPRHRPVFLVAAIWLGMTRVLVGAHFPSDVLAGLTFGAWSSVIIAAIFARYGFLFEERDTGLPLLKRSLPLKMPWRHRVSPRPAAADLPDREAVA